MRYRLKEIQLYNTFDFDYGHFLEDAFKRLHVEHGVYKEILGLCAHIGGLGRHLRDPFDWQTIYDQKMDAMREKIRKQQRLALKKMISAGVFDSQGFIKRRYGSSSD